KVIIASDDKTSFAGTILALGGKLSGDGGFAAITSHGVLQFTGGADMTAPHGDTGNLLLKAPRFAVLTEEGGRRESWITGSTLADLLNTSNVKIVAAKGSINVAADVDWGSNTLALKAAHNIAIDGALTTDSGMLKLDAGRKITATDTVSVG